MLQTSDRGRERFRARRFESYTVAETSWRGAFQLAREGGDPVPERNTGQQQKTRNMASFHAREGEGAETLSQAAKKKQKKNDH